MPNYRKVPQYQLAAERSQEVRGHRARFKQELKAMDADAAMMRVAEQVIDPHPDMESMKVGALLEALPRVGAQKATRMLMVAGIRSPAKRLDGMTFRQRTTLCALLGHHRADEVVNHGKLTGATLAFGSDVLT